MTSATVGSLSVGRPAVVPLRRKLRALARSRSMPAILAWPFAVLVSAFILQYSIYLVPWIFWDRLIKLTSLFLLLLLFPYRRMPRKFGWTLALFGALFCTAGVASVVVGDFTGVIQLIKVMIGFMILPIVVFRFREGDAPAPSLVKLLMFWGFLFAVQSLVLWVLVIQNHVPERTLILIERLDNMFVWSYGILGYNNILGWMREGFFFFRPAGWFLEPSNLAAFMLYPAFTALGLHLTTRRLRYLMAALVCGAGLAFAFSLAGYVAAIAAIVVLLVVRPRKSARKRPLYFWIAPFLAAVAFLVAARFTMNLTYQVFSRGELFGQNRISYLLGRDPGSQRLVQPYYKVTETIALLSEHPLGIGLGNTQGFNETTSPNAFVYWAVAGGIPAILVTLSLFAHLFYSYCIPMLMSPFPHYRYMAASFVGVTVHDLSYGTWMSPFYIFIVALVIIATSHVERLRREARQKVQNA